MDHLSHIKTKSASHASYSLRKGRKDMYNLIKITPNNKANNRYVISQVSCTAQDQTETLHNSQLIKVKIKFSWV